LDLSFQVKGQKPPAPIRGLKASDAGDDDDEDDDDKGDDDGDDNAADLVPRNDIG
jgi:hypothetical protein